MSALEPWNTMNERNLLKITNGPLVEKPVVDLQFRCVSLDGSLELCTGDKGRNLPGFDLDDLFGLGVDSLARFALLDEEGSETDQSNRVALLQTLVYRTGEGFQSPLGIGLAEIGLGGHGFNQLRLVH